MIFNRARFKFISFLLIFLSLAAKSDSSVFVDSFGSNNSNGVFAKYYSQSGHSELVKKIRRRLVAAGDKVDFVFEKKDFSWMAYMKIYLQKDGLYYADLFHFKNLGNSVCLESVMRKMSYQSREQVCYLDKTMFSYQLVARNRSPSRFVEVAFDDMMKGIHLHYIYQLGLASKFINGMNPSNSIRVNSERLNSRIRFAYKAEIYSMDLYLLQNDGWMPNFMETTLWSRKRGIKLLDSASTNETLKLIAALNRLEKENSAYASQYFMCPGEKNRFVSPDVLSKCEPSAAYGNESFVLFLELEKLGFKYNESTHIWE